MRIWIATALLAGSWLPGIGYFQPANYLLWLTMLLIAVWLLSDLPLRLPRRAVRIWICGLLLFPMWRFPVPYCAAPVVLGMGILASLLPIPRLWLRRVSRGAVAASTILLAQSVAVMAFQMLTARGHELPSPLASVFGAMPSLMGLDAAVDGASIAIRNGLDVVRVGLTWELLLDPSSFCFLVGSGVTLLLMRCGHRRKCSFRQWWWHYLVLLAATVLWLPFRVAIQMSLVLQLQQDPSIARSINAGRILANSWTHLALLVGMLLFFHLAFNWAHLKIRQLDVGASTGSRVGNRSRKQILATIACVAGVLLVAFAYYANPIGQRKSGRIMVVERHSTWEPTLHPYDTEVYGEAGSYNYAAVFEYCRQFYHMDRLLESEAIDRDRLNECDVLVIKTPTARYSQEEIQHVLEFVDRGGALLLIGDHTNVFNMNTYLNDIARRIGFTFRHDLLFQISDPYRQEYVPPQVPHPAVGYVPPMVFAVSCSIDPGLSCGRMAVQSVGLWSLPPAYHESNYHPQAEYRSYLQCGSWCQLWTTTYGKGRVAAFADSTLFSNFCVFQPGKKELFVGMLEWLNHGSVLDQVQWQWAAAGVLVILGVGMLVFGVQSFDRQHGRWLLLLACVLAAWAVASWGVAFYQNAAFPWPPKRSEMPQVVIDRTLSDVPLFTGAFADEDSGLGYGMLEQWIPRIGNYTSRASGQDTFQGDAVVIICPTEIPNQDFRERLVRYVEAGGHLLVLDSPDVQNSTANSVLQLFAMRAGPTVNAVEARPLELADGQIQVPIQAALEIEGGRALAKWNDTTVAAQRRFGDGTITAIGFGSLFNDSSMGYHWLAEPAPEVLQRYELLYVLLRKSLL
jgi:hypothetical protein